jgi:CSLREA domain-containing protein
LRFAAGITLLAIIPSLLVIGAVAARAATFAVNSTVDAPDATPGDGVCESGPGSGVCTLRAAVDETNALAGPDIVDVPGGLYPLLSGELHVSDDLTISGAGASATIIDGGGGIFVGPVTAHIGGVTVRHLQGVNAYSSGAIVNVGTLTLSDSVVGANLVGGIYNEGTLTVENVLIRGNSGATLGGGIASLGQLTVIGSTIADNSAGFGGGGVLVLSGSATLRNSTISGNSAVYGGGIEVGVCALGCILADAVLENVTITNNRTTTGDGGGVYVFSGGDGVSTLRVSNTVIAGNLDQGGEAPDCGPGLTSDGYNLIGNTAGCGMLGDTTGNVTGVSAKLGPLQENGGPTPTHAPLLGSPVIDAGNPAVPGSGSPACEALDQQGVPRPQGVRCDIGAVESGGTPTTSTTTSTSTTTTTIAPICGQVPLGGCQASLSGKGSLLIKDRSDDTKDLFGWKWRSSGPTAKTDFGSPITTTDYAVCVYDQSTAGPTLRLAAIAPAGGVCAGTSCWKETSSGFRYADRQLTPDGLTTIRLKAGAAGAGRITVKGRGAPLPLPSLPLVAPVMVQLQRRDGAACWMALFSAPATNASGEFKAND